MEAMSRLEDHLTCAICLERYTDPRALACQHNFCMTCISRLPGRDEQSIKCPCCFKSTQLRSGGVSALPVAFHINSLLEIDDMLRRAPTSELHSLCAAHSRVQDMYCETCDQPVCIKCSRALHQDHHYDLASDLYEKHVREIVSSLEPVNELIDEVSNKLTLYDSTEKAIREQGDSVKNEVDQTIQELVDRLQQTRKALHDQVETTTRQKLQLHALERAEVETIFAQLKSCKEFVEEELRSQSQHQIQTARKKLVQRITETHSSVKVSELQPGQVADTAFLKNEETFSEYACSVGSVRSTLHCHPNVMSLFSVLLPQRVFAGPGQVANVFVTTPFSLLPEQLSCKLSPVQQTPIPCPVVKVDNTHFYAFLQPKHVGLHKLSVSVGGADVKGSPFLFSVLPSADMREQHLKVVARGLKGPYSLAVTQDGQHVVVAERDGSRVTILTSTGRVVRRFGSHGSGPGKFINPLSVAVSSTNHIYVADLNTIQKFTFSGSFVSMITGNVYGLAFHPSGHLLTINTANSNVDVLNPNLSHSHTFGELKYLKNAYDLAVDTKGNVYLLTHKHGIHKLSITGCHIATICNNGQQPTSSLLGICIDSNDLVYTTNTDDQQITMLTANGECLGNFGSQAHKPHGIAVSYTGDLYVCDYSRGDLLVYYTA